MNSHPPLASILSTAAQAARLNARFRDLTPARILRYAILHEFPCRIAVVSSFGT